MRRGQAPARVADIRWSSPLLFATIAAFFAAGSLLGWISFGNNMIPPLVLYSGATVAVMMLTPRSRWWAIVAAILVTQTAIDLTFGVGPAQSVGFAVANSVEPLVGASLALAWCGGPPDLRRRSDLAKYVGAACLTAPFVSGLLGGALVTTVLPEYSWPTAIWEWMTADGLGVLVVGAPILLWHKQSQLLRSRTGEVAWVGIATAGLSVLAFVLDTPPTLWLLPVMVWTAFRLDVIGVALTGVIVALMANYMTVLGYGPFAGFGGSLISQRTVTQAFVAVIVLVSMLAAQEASGRAAATDARQAERRERLRLEGLAALAQQLSAAQTKEQIGEFVVGQALETAGVKSVTLGLLSDDGRRLEWVRTAGWQQKVLEFTGSGVPIDGPGPNTEPLRTGRPVLVRTMAEAKRRYPRLAEVVDASGAQTLVGWPLKTQGVTFGSLLLAWEDEQPLDSAQLSFISAVATLVEQALDRAKIYADEHARAVVLHAAVSPTVPSETPGLQVCVVYEPAEGDKGLGGDWFDVMTLPKDRTYLTVGDVVGHGLAAVEDMAQLRSAGRALGYQGMPTDQLLSELNRFTDHTTHSRFATMFVVVFDATANLLTYSSAGHPPALFRRAATAEVIRLSDAHGPVLGPVADAVYSRGALAVAPDDILLMYTDGLVERRGLDIDDGIARLQQLVTQWDPHVVGECATRLGTFADSPREDDVCAIAVRFTAERSAACGELA